MADHEMNAVHSVVPPAPQTVEQDHEMNESATGRTDQVNPNTEPLRNASPLPDSESEPPTPVPQPDHTGPHLTHAPVNHAAQTLQYLQRFGLQTFLWLQFLWALLGQAASTTQTVGLGVVRSLQTHLYVFFQNSTYPYRQQDIVLAGPGIAPVEWYYNADTKTFVSHAVYNTSTDYETHHFEWLSGLVKYNDLVLYDISEFLQQLRWAGTSRPSIARVLSAWSLHSGTVLALTDSLTLQVINTDGTESTLSCRG